MTRYTRYNKLAKLLRTVKCFC